MAIIQHRYREAGLETDWIENSSEYHQRWHQPILRNALQVIHTFMSGCPGPELPNTKYIRSIIRTDHLFIGRCQNYNIMTNDIWWEHKLETVVENEEVTIFMVYAKK